jgi:hypothetical protein
MRSTWKLLILVGAFGLQHHCSSPALKAAEPPVPKPIAGTVADFKTSSLQIVVKADDGRSASFSFGPQTEVVQVPPGERDLTKAKPAHVTDLSKGDRILVSFVSGLSDARRIVWISATDIAARNETERLDWQKRGISGTVVSSDGSEVTIETKTPAGSHSTILAVSDKTVVRRYSPDSVSFVDALPSTAAKISKGDQVKARGSKIDDKIAADDIVFGTFLSKIGTIKSIDTQEARLQIEDTQTQQLLTIKISPQSQFKMLPDMKTMFAQMMKSGSSSHDAPPPEANVDVAKIIAGLPAGKLEDLKPGSTVIVTSTTGSRPDVFTAILLIGNADGMIQFVRSTSGKGDKMSPTEAVSSLHGGMLGSPASLNIPTILP